MDHLCLVFVMLSRLFIAALWSPEGEGLASWLLFVSLFMILLLSDPCCLSYFNIGLSENDYFLLNMLYYHNVARIKTFLHVFGCFGVLNPGLA